MLCGHLPGNRAHSSLQPSGKSPWGLDSAPAPVNIEMLSIHGLHGLREAGAWGEGRTRRKGITSVYLQLGLIGSSGTSLHSYPRPFTPSSAKNALVYKNSKTQIWSCYCSTQKSSVTSCSHTWAFGTIYDQIPGLLFRLAASHVSVRFSHLLGEIFIFVPPPFFWARCSF